jgi:lysozyme
MSPEDRGALQAQLVRHEDEVLHAYQDSLGYWTIGVGHLIDKRLGGTIPQFISRLLLDHDIDECLRDCSRAFPWFDSLDSMRQRVWIDLRFNLGLTRLLMFKATIAAMERNDFQAAAAHLEDSKWFTQVGKRGPWICQALRTGAEPPT